MALVNASFVEETTTTTGQGTLDLGGATTGNRTFVAAIGDGNTCWYGIASSDGNFETGIGTVADALPDTLARTTLLTSTTGSKLDLPLGTHRVYCTLPAEKLGDAAALDVGTSAGTVAAGDDSRIVNALQTSDVDDTPVNGATTAPVSSNWAFDHAENYIAHDLPNENIGPTTSDTNLDANKHYFVNASNLTNDRALLVPDGTAGDIIWLTYTAVHGTYSLSLDGLSPTTAINGSTDAVETSSTPYHTIELRCHMMGDWYVRTHTPARASTGEMEAGTEADARIVSPAGVAAAIAALAISELTASTSTTLGVGSIELGHASDTTIARTSAGDITVEGNIVYRAGGTDVPVTDGGTGLSYDTINGAEATIASATTTAIGGLSSNHVSITGTTTITGFGTVAAGVTREGRFTGVLTLTHNATSLILPGAANIITAAGDRFKAISLGSGNWCIYAYTRANGYPVGMVELLGYALTDETASIEAGQRIQDYVPAAMRVSRIYVSCTQPTGQAMTLDVEKAGTTVLASEGAISVSTSATYAEVTTFASSAAYIDFAKNDLLTIDCNQAPTGGGAAVKIHFFGSYL